RLSWSHGVSRPSILLTTDLLGGVWDFALALASALAGQVLLLALGEPSAAQCAAAQAVAETVFAPLKLEWMHDSAADVQQTQQLVRDLVRQHKPEVVHANQFAIACADLDVPVVLTTHSDVL